MTPLRVAREAAGFRTRPAAVAAFINLAGHRRVKLTATRDSITRMMRGWENGDHEVKEPYLGILCILYQKSADELGLSTTPAQARSDIGLIYSASLADALQTIADLAKFDGQQHPGVIAGQFSEEAISAACLDWLFGHPKWDLGKSSHRITARHVDEVVATTQMFDAMDRQRGGEHARNLAVKYLFDTVVPALRGMSESIVRKDLFRAGSILCELIGYMAYDSGRHSLAERYFIQALRLAKEAGDNAYGAFVLNTLSHQAIYLGRPQSALRLAQAARQIYHGSVTPVVMTESAMLEAQASASLGDASNAAAALGDAERAFTRQGSDITPTWASHWSETLFNSFAGDCWLTLGETEKARPHLVAAWNGSQQQSRRKIFAAGQLAKAALLDHDIEQAANYASIAVEAIDGTHSRRSLHVVSELHRELTPHRDSGAVRIFTDRMRHLMAG